MMGDTSSPKRVRVQDSRATCNGTSHLEPAAKCTCLLMDPGEAATITISFADVASGLVPLMEDKGVAIVTNVLEAGDIETLEKALKNDMEELVDLDACAGADSTVKDAWERVCREGMHAWPAASLADVGARGRFQDRGLPHGRFAWQARTHPRVMRVYEVLHGTKDLVSSVDNAFVANASQEEVTENKSWPHVDQNDHDSRVPCKEWNVYQGILYLWSSSDSSHRSTTVIWPESHKTPYVDYMADANIARRIQQGKPHFSLMSAMEPGEVRDGLIQGWQAHARRIPVPAGSLLLWTSRTTHQGWSGGPRLAQPVCWEPRSRRDEVMRERKLRLAALGLPSTHWASLALPHELSDLTRPLPVSAAPSANHEHIHFPLCASIRSQALKETADVDVLWKHLKDPDWFARLPDELKMLLEESIADEYKRWL
mmetsp:Transcript_14587/g.25830  ORF Transcript_14587/g.25830 Transcript_14587/m.25830 type:complete len:427 (-) Transcript_14587:127-1407(-)